MPRLGVFRKIWGSTKRIVQKSEKELFKPYSVVNFVKSQVKISLKITRDELGFLYANKQIDFYSLFEQSNIWLCCSIKYLIWWSILYTILAMVCKKPKEWGVPVNNSHRSGKAHNGCQNDWVLQYTDNGCVFARAFVTREVCHYYSHNQRKHGALN